MHLHHIKTPPRKVKTAIFLTREYTRNLYSRISHEIHKKGLSRTIERLLDLAKPELDPQSDKFNEAAYREYLKLLEKYKIPLPTR
jgi:tRNA A37 N6-isopentenylltransferase MiaA